MKVTKPNREQITRDIRSALETMEFNFQYNEDAHAFTFNQKIDAAISSMSVIIVVRNEDFFIMTTAPLKGDAKNERQIAELSRLIMRMNYQLVHGAYNLDVSDGEIKFQVSCLTYGMTTIPTSLIVTQLMLCAHSWETAAKKFLGVLFAGLTGDAAFELEE